MWVIDVGDDIYNKTDHEFLFYQGFNFILKEINRRYSNSRNMPDYNLKRKYYQSDIE